MQCCAHYSQLGRWFFPDGTVVRSNSYFYNPGFFQTRGNDGTVKLHRRDSTILSPNGLFCCVVPDANFANQVLCANIISKLS